jgi:uncharacterized membrane-anchored protein/membrane protein DedA with SNARE-associated domain
MHLFALLNFTNFVATAGYSAIFLLCLLQSCCVPTSSELTMGFAGVLAAEGKLSLGLVIVVGVAGEVVGAYIAWFVGRYAGRAAVDRYGRYLLLTHRDLDRAEDWYDRHQRFGVFGSRLLPVIRNFVAVPAGIAEVPLVRFGVLTAAGSLLWVGAWALLGYGVGGHWHTIAKAIGDLGYVLAVVAVGVIAYAAYHRYRSYKEATATGGGGSMEPTAVETTSAEANGHVVARDALLRSELDTDTSRRRIAGSRTPGGRTPSSRTWGVRTSGARTPGARTPGGRTRGSRIGGSRRPNEVRWLGSSSGLPPARPRHRDFPNSPVAAWEAAVVNGRRDVATPIQPPRGGAQHRRTSPRGRGASGRAAGQLPLIGSIFPAPLAAKVPEVIFVFWVVKILTTAGGEAMSDYLRVYGNIKGGAIEVGMFVVGLLFQFGTRRYRAFAYWFLAFAIATFGTGVADFLHLDVHIPYSGTTLMWAAILAVVFVLWQRSEGTLSIHSITTQRREGFYWATVFATFALGTALGDFTADSLNLGYLGSIILFGVVILIPAALWWKAGLNAIAAFWMSYVLTRPLGASIADYLSKPHSLSGINGGDLPVAIAFAVAVFVVVAYLAVARPDIQHSVDTPAGASWHATGASEIGGTGTSELELDAE